MAKNKTTDTTDNLAPTGLADFVLANGSMLSNQLGEGEIRKAIIEADLAESVVATRIRGKQYLAATEWTSDQYVKSNSRDVRGTA